MKTAKKKMSGGLTRRDALKLSGLALGSLALGGTTVGAGTAKALAQSQLCDTTNGCNYPVKLFCHAGVFLRRQPAPT